MTGPGPDKHRSMMVHESVSVPFNHRDASSSSAVWKHAPTPISVPTADERPRPPRRPDDNKHLWPKSRPVSGPAAYEHHSRPRRSHDTPFTFNNTLEYRTRPGNPNVARTLLAQPPIDRSVDADSRAPKRPRLDTSVLSTTTSAGASTSYSGILVHRNRGFEPDIQVIDPPRWINNHSNPVPNDAEIIDLEASSGDMGERVPRPKSSSPDPISLRPLPQPRLHPFCVRPTEYRSSNKGKGRAKEPPELVEGSEEEDEITEWTPPSSTLRPSDVRKSPKVPANFVNERKKIYEHPRSPVSAPAAIRHHGVNSVDLISNSIIGRMKKRDESTSGRQRSTGMSDHVGTSSSNFTNSAREREKTQTLPLDAWCFGHHLLRHSESSPIQLVYEIALQKVTVTWGHSPPETIEFMLNRDVDSVMIVNDIEEPLKKNVVVQFNTVARSEWQNAEQKYEGFEAGAVRGRGVLTFLFATAKERGLCPTDYQKFVTGIRKAFKPHNIQTIKPSKGASIWEYANNCAEMFARTQTRSPKENRSESVPDEPSPLIRSTTPCSSISVRTGPEIDPGPPVSYRRSARQSAMRTLRAPTPLLQAQLDSDEVVLMYPPTGTGALSITQGDLRRLQPEEYLNDTLIEFGLKLWLQDLHDKNPALADQIHVFSSFFYKKLNNRKNPEDGYNSVRKWTSKVKLFTKKYVIVPINENVHWYLAIIYEPGHTLEPPLPLLQPRPSDARMTRKRKQQERAQAHSETLTEVSLEQLNPAAHAVRGELEADTSSMDATRATTPTMTENDEMDDVAIIGFDRSCSITAKEPTSSEFLVREPSPNLIHPPSDGMDVDAHTSVTEVAEVPGPSTSKTSSGIPVSQFYGSMYEPGDMQPAVVTDNEDYAEDQQQEAEVDDMLAVTQSPTGDLSQTYIFTLDSLGARHPQAIKVLKQYLRSEAKDKEQFDEVREAVGKQVQVPVQPNTWDCGIYLLHFVKVFMNAPSEFVEQILSTKGTIPSSERKKTWQDHEVPQFRDYLSSRIFQLSEEWQAEKIMREEEANRRRSGRAQEVDALSSDGEVDIVEDVPSVKPTPGPKRKQPAVRLRG